MADCRSIFNSLPYFSAWLFRIARNNVIDYYRSLKKVDEIKDDYASDENIEYNFSNKFEHRVFKFR